MHGVDVEGMQLGIDEELVALLGRCSPVPVTYAGGARTLVRLAATARTSKIRGLYTLSPVQSQTLCARR